MARNTVNITYTPLRLLDGFFVADKDAKESTIPLAQASKDFGFSPEYRAAMLALKAGDIVVLMRNARLPKAIFPLFLRGENSVEALTRREPDAASRIVRAYRITAADPRYRLEVLSLQPATV